MQCKNCGRDVKSDFKYCPYCANRLINDFEDHYGELNPPYVMPDITDQEPDAAAFLYGRARVIPDESNAFFAPEQTAASKQNADIQSTASEKENRPLPYEVYRPEPVDHVWDLRLPEKEFSSESDLHSPRHEGFRANLPDELPDDLVDDLPDLPEEDCAPESEDYRAPREGFRANLPDELLDDLVENLPDLPEEDCASESEDYRAPREGFRANLPNELPDDLVDDLPDLPEEDCASEPEVYRAPREKTPYAQPPTQELVWETQLSDDESEEQSNKTLEDAPYVVMQPDVEETVTRTRATVQNPGPSLLIKLLLILFMVLLGVLASFLLYQFRGNFNIANRLESISSVAASCWQQAWNVHYFL